MQVEITCPLKVNLTLSVLGRRADGFHALHSVVAQARDGDCLSLEWMPGVTDPDSVVVEGADLDGGSSTVATALRLVREQVPFPKGKFHARLSKRIPVGAGLGGGSSDAVGTLRGVQELFPELTRKVDWPRLAAAIGSDCPLFLDKRPVIMEGRGEVIQPLDPVLADRLSGQSLLLFKPAFSIATAEAYRRLAQAGLYRAQEAAMVDLSEWRKGRECLPPAWNDFERLVDLWLPSLALVLHQLRENHGLDVRMSGSGSACFIFPKDAAFARNALEKVLTTEWGDRYLIQEIVLN